jgi:multiple sugar transport system ATP-binding protein
MATLEVRNLSKRFGRIQALNDVSLSVKDGEFMVLLGPTAAGKTTTLRCVAGLEKVDNGTLSMNGEEINRLSPAERDLAFVFQTYALYPRKTAYENMAFPLKARKMSAAEIDRQIHDVAAKLHITELLKRRPAEMSGGQQQRVALGRAMVRQPRMFLMDEPLTNLDFKLRVEMRAELKRIQRELATTFFYVTNDQVEAMSVADRIAVLDHGVLQQVDSPENVYDHPANLFVARFVGSPRMNTLECSLDKGSRQLCGDSGQWVLGLSAEQLPVLERVSNPSALTLGIRPEDIGISLTEQTSAVPGEIYILELLGDCTYVDVSVGGETVRARADADFSALVGSPIWLTFDSERFHVFDRASGVTIF